MKQLDPATGQSTASSPDAGHTGEPADPADETTSALERRRAEGEAVDEEEQLPEAQE